MSEHYVCILVQMASVFGWPVRVLYWYAKYYTGVDGDFMWMASDHNLKSVTRLMITSNTARIVTAKIQVAVVNWVNYTGAHGDHAKWMASVHM